MSRFLRHWRVEERGLGSRRGAETPKSLTMSAARPLDADPVLTYTPGRSIFPFGYAVGLQELSGDLYMLRSPLTDGNRLFVHIFQVAPKTWECSLICRNTWSVQELLREPRRWEVSVVESRPTDPIKACGNALDICTVDAIGWSQPVNQSVIVPLVAGIFLVPEASLAGWT
ncbi:hypothetical protein BC567DRAFT_226685 [Phyllosticta citribraziliensis]